VQTFTHYLAELRANLSQGDATEHTHRAALQRLLESSYPGFIAVNEAQRIACGSPDLSLRKGKVPIGHVETKDIGTNLDEVERGKGPHGAQFKRYLAGMSNWVLTDYLEFRWYVAGQSQPRLTATLATLDGNKKLKAMPGGADAVEHLLRAFLNQPALTIETAKELATRMAGITHVLREVIDQAFQSGTFNEKGWLNQWLASFRETLLPELKEGEFADIFAQTLAYGLFAARIQTASTHTSFSREQAAFAVPRSNPFLRSIFSQMAGAEMPEVFAWAVDDLVRLLQHTDIASVLRDFGHATGQNDPVVHFYETFLAAYDPKLREKRGVYYTPEPVVRYMVRSVDHLLKTCFNKPKGLADEQTLILDPATGTATFLYFIIQHIYQGMASQRGAWPGYVADHLLQRIFGFELLMAPYAIAHLKLALELEETGYTFKAEERLGIYLTNTLEEAAKKSERLVARAISDEANAAAEIKRGKPIMVVIGNPPYSGHSANRSRDTKGDLTFIGKLIEDYKRVDGAELGEKNPKWLQDDYVKFIRFAQWRIEKTGHGVLAFITNHGYLDNPTFRGMRRSLMQSFSEIYVYDLHGNSKKKEENPSGGKDENVFDIQQGVAILLAVRQPDQEGAAKVWHAELWGDRHTKYAALSDGSLAETSWTELAPTTPAYLFAVQNGTLSVEYEPYTKITDAMPVNVLGFQTHRDDFAIDFVYKVLHERIAAMRQTKLNDVDFAEQYGLKNNRDWMLDRARKQLRDNSQWEESIIQCAYRPFDTRWGYFSEVAMDYPRRELKENVAGKENLCLGIGRQGLAVQDSIWSLITCSVSPIDANIFRRGGVNVSPLYLYEGLASTAQDDLFAGRRPNLSRRFLDALAASLHLPQEPEFGLPEGISPEDIFHYIYAIFHAPGYRARYAEFLKRDFPRVPLTTNLALFRALAAKGRELVSLHLLKVEDAPQLNQFATQFRKTGTNMVDKVKYDADKQRVWVNDDQYFEGVPSETWNFHIGGYQVCEKWLKDRKKRKLSHDDLQHWQRMVVALTETRRLMQEIDALVPAWPLH
jgi:predicted helicase